MAQVVGMGFGREEVWNRFTIQLVVSRGLDLYRTTVIHHIHVG